VEKVWLIGALNRKLALATSGVAALWTALRDPRVFVLTFMFFCFGISSPEIVFWISRIVKEMSGLSNPDVGFVTALPWLAAILVMTLVGWNSGRTGERHLHVAGRFRAGALGLIGAANARDPTLAMVRVGAAAAGAIALINATGNLGGFVGPYPWGSPRRPPAASIPACRGWLRA